MVRKIIYYRYQINIVSKCVTTVDSTILLKESTRDDKYIY